MLDAILFPDEDESRYHAWAEGFEQGSVFAMNNGEGDFYFVWLPTIGGAVIRGFDHESAMSPWSSQRKKTPDAGKPWPGLFDGLPEGLAAARDEPAFGGDEVTFCAWWSRNDERAWRIGDVTFPKKPKDPDGSERLLPMLDGDPRTYLAWAEEYAEHPVSLAAVKDIYALAPLTEALIRGVHPDADVASVLIEAKTQRYPVAPTKPKKRTEPATFIVVTDGKRTTLREGTRVIAEAKGDCYDDLLALVRGRLKA